MTITTKAKSLAVLFVLLVLSLPAPEGHCANNDPGHNADPNIAKQKGNGWLIEYKQPMVGRVEVRLSPWGSVVATQLFNLMIRVPDLKALIFNNDTKKYVVFSKDEAIKRIQLLAHQSNKKWKFGEWHKVGTERLRGYDTTKYQRDLVNPQHNEHVRTEYHEVQYIVSYDFFGNAKQIKAIMDPINLVLAYGGSGGNGWILQETTYWKKYRDNKLVTDEPADLITLDSIKKATFKKSDFEIEKRYKLCKDETEVMISDDGEMPGVFSQFKGRF